MARVPLTGGFQLIPEGTYVFLIYDVRYDEDFGKIEIKMITAKGQTYTERFNIKKDDDSYNEAALGAFSYFAKTAMDDFESEDIETDDLKGHYIMAEVVHTKSPSKKNPDRMVTFANLGDKAPADGFTEEPVQRVQDILTRLGNRSAPAPAVTEKKPAFDLDSLFD